MVVADAIGWAGAVIVIATYAHVARAGLRSAHHVANAAGGAALASGAVAHGTWPSVAENVVWVALACYGLRPRGRRAAGAQASSSGREHDTAAGAVRTTHLAGGDLAGGDLAAVLHAVGRPPPAPSVSPKYGRR